MRRQRHQPFRKERERAWWLLLVACAAAGLWAVAQVLAWPIPARAALAAVAAAVGLIVPEFRARRAAVQRQEQLVDRVEVRGRRGRLPQVREVSDAQLRVHASRLEVPYIERDKQAEVDSALVARRPLLIVGHSMAGKTRLAAFRVRKLCPDAALLAPLPGVALRELVENRLDLADTVVWLDDLERYLTGENWLDPGLLDALVAGGAQVVATIRRNALDVYRPRNEARPPQWETVSRFKRVELARLLSAEESRTVDANVTDSVARAAIHRYGLAEYLGAGPDAVDRFDSGETECPVGAALVRAAIDWRRAGLARLIRRRDLRAAFRIYLRDRPDVSVEEASVTAGLQWAMEKVNETVSLLVPNYSAGGENAEPQREDGDLPLFEVFDYLVDVLEERAASPDRAERDKALIPIDMYRLVLETASRAERLDVEMAARAQFKFIGRTEELAELTSWLASPLGSSPPLGILHGLGGMGKTAILRRLQELADPRTRELVAEDPTQLLVNVPHFDIVLGARGRIGTELVAAMCSAAGLESSPGETDDACAMHLLDALRGRRRPMIIAIDGLDEAIDPEQAMNMLLELYRADDDLPLRILVSTRQRPPQIQGVVRVFEVGGGTRQDLVEFARYRLVGKRGSGSAEPADQTAQVIADFAGGSFLASAIICGQVVNGSLPSDPAMLAQKLAELLQSVGAEGDRSASIQVQLERWLASLGERKSDALVLLTALARGPAQGMTAEEWLGAASRLGHRPYSKVDLDWLSRGAVVGRSRGGGAYLLHDLVRVWVLDYQDHGSQARPPRGDRE
jgi:AAA ATPase domain